MSALKPYRNTRPGFAWQVHYYGIDRARAGARKYAAMDDAPVYLQHYRKQDGEWDWFTVEVVKP